MALGVLNNIAAVYAQNSLGQTQSSLQAVLQQLSSGQRINSGADDPAGLAVASGLAGNQAALTQSSANAIDGVGFLQTADGALAQVTNLLDSAVSIATEAANGTLTTNQVSSANQEYQNILGEINNIGSTTNFNSIGVFQNVQTKFFESDGSSTGANIYSDTVGSLSTANIGSTAAVSTVVAPSAATTPTTTVGAASTLSLASNADLVAGTLSLALGGAASQSTTVSAGTTLAALALQINNNATYSAEGISAAVGTGSNANVLTITGPAGASNTLSTTGTSLTDTPLTGAGAVLTGAVGTLTASTASTVLTTVTTAIADIAYQRGTLGADINELNAASNVASAEQVNLASAQNSILATDYGQATSNLSKYQVLSQTGISALAQANSVQQEVLKLLQ